MDNRQHHPLEISIGIAVTLAGVSAFYTMASGRTPGTSWCVFAWVMVVVGVVMIVHGLWFRGIRLRTVKRRRTRPLLTEHAYGYERDLLVSEIAAFRKTMRSDSSRAASVKQLKKLAELKLKMGPSYEVGGSFFSTEEQVRQECNRLIGLLKRHPISDSE